MTARRHVTVCVTCVGGRLIYDVISALRAAEDIDITIVGTDSDPDAPGRLLCDRFFVVPHSESDPEGYLSAFVNLHRDVSIDFLLALSEGESRLVAAHQALFDEHGIQTSVSSAETVMTMTDKLLMLRRAAAAGIDVGRFVAVDSEADAAAALRELGYPDRRVVLKPRQGRGSRGVLVADAGVMQFQRLLPNRFCGTGGFDQLRAAMAEEDMAFDELLAVPYYEGPVFDVDCIAIAGKATDIAARERQLRNPLWPTSTGHKTSSDPRVLDYAGLLCAAFEVDGAADFDIVLADGEVPRLFDAGARFSGSVGVSFVGGVNFPVQLIRTRLGLPQHDYHLKDGLILRPYITMAPIPECNEQDLL